MNKRKKTYKSSSKNIFIDILVLIKNSFVRDFKIKLFGLFFAVIVWIYIVMGNQYTYVFSVPFKLVNIVDGKTLKEPIPAKIKAELTGKGSELFFLYLSTISGFRFELDLQNIKSYYTYNLHEYYQTHPEKLFFPRNMSIEFNKIIDPDSIEVELDFYDSRKIPVTPDIFIDTEAGYIKSEELLVSPDSILVTGPRYYVQRINEILTDSLYLENANLPIEQDLRFQFPKHSTLKFSNKKVKIYQKIEQIGEKIIKDIPVKIINADDNLNLLPSPEVVSLKVSAALSHLTKMKPTDFEIKFDYKKSWQQGETYYKPEIIKPEQVLDIIEVIPERLNIRAVRERASK